MKRTSSMNNNKKSESEWRETSLSSSITIACNENENEILSPHAEIYVLERALCVFSCFVYMHIEFVS